MTAMRKVFPVTLPVESGWSVSQAEVRTAPFSPIALLTFTDLAGQHRHVRLDLGKRMFLDEPPTGVSLGSSELIANHLSNVVRIAVLG